MNSQGVFHSTKTSGNFGWGSKWNRHFLGFHPEILGVPHEVAWPKILENQNKPNIPFHSIIPAWAFFLRAWKSNSTWLILKFLKT